MLRRTWKDLVVEGGGVAALLARGISSFEPHLQDAAAFALGNLCADCKDGQRLVREGGGIEALVVLLAAPQAFVRKQAAWALGNVCDRSPPNRETARQAGAISALVACMDHPQVLPPVPSWFTLLRPYLAHFFPVFSRFLCVFTAWPRRFHRAPSRNPGPRNSRQGGQEA